MNLIFFGADQYSAVALQTILAASLPGDSRQVQVVTDKHEGGSPVEKLAKEHNLNVSYYPTLPDLSGAIGLCASFDHLIPQDIIAQFAGNLYNLHPSLLPQYRNVSPVQYAIALGDKETGITLFRISPGIDDGEIIAQSSEPILESDTTATLTPRLFKKGAELFLSYDPCKPSNIYKDRNFAIPAESLIFTRRLTRDSGFIDWVVLEKLLTGKKIEATETNNGLLNLRITHNPDGNILKDLLRALTPWPGIWSLVPTKKGELRIALVIKGSDLTGSAQPADSKAGRSDPEGIQILISGKHKAISLKDFTKYYL
jgi:methionyl-tRNA formyltransferase